jgi:hypothetical protein
MLSPPPSPLPANAKFADDNFQQHLLEKKTAGRRYTLGIFLIPFFLVVLAIPIPRFRFLCNDLALHYIPSLALSSSTFPSPSSLPSHFTSSRLLPTKRTPAASNIPTVPTASSTADSIVPTPFPEPFDLSLSWNFTTSSCQNFFLNFTQADDFRRCRPFSFLLGTSSKFTDVSCAWLLQYPRY